MAAKTVIAMDEEQTICREVLKQCMVDMMKLSTEDADCFLDICLTECETKEEKIRCAAFLWDLYMFSLRTQKGFMFDETVKWIDEYYSKEEFEQLESDEVFETFHRLDIKNAKKLFLRMGCKTTVVDGLCKSLRENDPKGFVRKMDKCDISKIAPHLYYFHNQIESLQLSSNEDKSEEEGEELEQYVINWRVRAETVGDKIISDELQLVSIYDESFTEEQNSAFLSYYYCCLLHSRAVLESKNLMTKKEKKVLHYILDIPDCVDLQNRFNDIWTSKISGEEFLEIFECVPEIREHYIEHYGLFPEGAELDQQAQLEGVELEQPKQVPKVNDETRQNVFKASEELIEVIVDFIAEDYEKKFIVGYFKRMLISSKYKNDSMKLVNELAYNRSKFEYKGLKVMHFCHIIGFLIAKGVIIDKPIDMARKIYPKLDRYPKAKSDPQNNDDIKEKRIDSIRLYIQDAKDFFAGTARKNIAGNNCIKKVFDDMSKKAQKKPKTT